MASKNFVFRMTSEGATQVINDLKAIEKEAPEAARALDALTKSSPQLASASDAASAKLQQTTATLKSHSDAADKATAASSNTSQAMRNLSIQAIQAASGLATGQPVMQVLIQQGHQVADSMLAGGQGLKSLTDALKGGVSAMGGWKTAAAGGVVAGLVEIMVQAEKSQRALADLSSHLQATRSDYAGLAQQVAEAARQAAGTSGIALPDARSVGEGFASLPNWAGSTSQLKDLILLTQDYAAATGKDLPAAMAKLRQAVNDPEAAVKQFSDDMVRGFTPALEHTVTLLQESGDKATAAAITMRTLQDAVGGAARNGMTEMEKSLNDLKAAWYGGADGAKGFLDTVGVPMLNTLARTTSAIASMVGGITDLVNSMDKLSNSPAGRFISMLSTLGGPSPAILLLEKMAGTGPGASAAGTTATPTAPGSLAAPSGAAYDAQGFINQALRSQLAGAAVSGTPIPPSLFQAMIAQESGWNVNAPNGGLAQILASTARKPGYGMQGVDPTSITGGGADAIAGNLNFAAQYLYAKAKANGVSDADWATAAGQNRALRAYNGGGDPLYAEHVRARMAGGGDASTSSAAVGGTFLDNNTAFNDTLRLAQQNGSVFNTRNSLSAQLEAAIKARTQAAPNSDGVPSRDYLQLNDLVESLTGKINTTMTPQGELIRSLQDQAKYSSAPYGGDQTMLSLRQRFADLDRQGGHTTSQAEVGQAFAAQNQIQTNSLDKLVANLDQTTDANKRLTDATGQGNDAVKQATAYNQAYQTVLETLGRDAPNFASQVERVAAAYKRQADSADALQRKQSALNDLASTTDSIFGDMYSAATGATTWQSAWTNAIQAVGQELFKLSVTNPLENALFGGNRGTLGDLGSGSGGGGLLGGLFSSIFGGASGAGGAGAAAIEMGGLYANGGVFMNSPSLSAFSGSVVDRPTYFKFADGMGLMGEAGPEAILPLGRDAAGKLGIRTRGDSGGDTHFHAGDVNVQVAGTNASAAQIAAAAKMGGDHAVQKLVREVNQGGRAAKTFGRRR